MRVSIARRTQQPQVAVGGSDVAATGGLDDFPNRSPVAPGGTASGRAESGRGVVRAASRRGVCGVVFIVVGVLGCGIQTRTETSDFDEYGRPADGYSVQATVVDKEKAQLGTARALARTGDYATAIATLTPLYGRRDLDAELQQEVLLTLGEMHAAPLNAQRDYGKARTYLEELIRDHPDSEHADRARKLLDGLPR